MNFMQATTKTIRIGLTTAAVLAIAAGCASQGSSTASDASDATIAVNAADDTGTQFAAPAEQKTSRLVCRKIKPTGSRFAERICMRPEQWEKYAGHARKELDKVQSRGLTQSPSGG